MRIRNSVALALALGWLATLPTVQAALPTVDRLEPLGVVRGEETTVIFHGQRVRDAYSVVTDRDGLEIVSVKPIDNKQVEVRIRTDPSLAPGLYPVRLVTKSGIANLRLIGVGTMPVVKEVEPNNDFATPQTIELNRTIEGRVDQEDVDHYRVHLEAGDKLTCEIEGIRLAYSLNNRNILDPFIAILDEGRFELVTSDDSALLQQDGVCTFTAETAGDYTVLVRDSAFGGSSASGYRLHLGDFPRPAAVFPPRGAPGAMVETTLIDVDGTVTEAAFQLPSQATDRWAATTTTGAGTSPSPNWVRVNELPVIREAEPNDDRTKAPLVVLPAALCGVVEQPGDFDCFGFECKKGQKFRVQVCAREILRSPLDAVVNVFGPDQKTIQSSDDSGGKLDPYLEFTAPADGRHSIRIYDHLRGGSPLHLYRIEVSAFEPEFGLVLKELRRSEAMVLPIPAGGSAGMVVQAQRRGYNGAIELTVDTVPEGVSVQTFPLPSGRNEIPVLLTATADAEHSAALFDLHGKGAGDQAGVTGELKQNHPLVLGQNRRAMWSYDTDRATAAVTDAAPFELELVQPQTPIVRSGNKHLLVKIKRDEGFDGVVSLRTLYNPPGIGINNSRKIEKGKSAVSIPITANGRAALGTWPLIMVASYGTDNGGATIASNAIMLDVQDALFKYDFPRSAAELGAETAVTVSIEVLRDYDGKAEVQLLGLPNGVTSSAVTQPIQRDSKTVSFPIQVAEDAKIGNHKTLVVQSRVHVGDEAIIQTTGTGELRLDQPLPPKAESSTADDKPKPAEKPAAAAKPLSRLEQLRQQKSTEERKL